MIAVNVVWRFALCSLAVWLIAHLLSGENGLWDMIGRLRSALGSSALGRLMDCHYSLSLLISLPLAVWLSSSWIGFLVQWLALSAAACLLERATQRPHRRLRVSPIPASFLDKVIDGA
ncbi:MAG: hypothetical protein ABSE51_08505 [Terracidiphilus sp.]|jgi:hypothetical protein